MNVTALTIEMWIKTPTVGTSSPLGLIGNDPLTGASNRDYDLYLYGDATTNQTLRLQLSSGPLGDTTQTLDTPLAPNSVHYIAITASTSGTTTYYVDGVKQSTSPTVAASPSGSAMSSAGLTIAGNNCPWNSSVQDVALYSSVLPASRIQAHYNAGYTA